MPPTVGSSPQQGSLLVRAVALSRTPGFRKIWRYGATSVVSTVVTLVFLYLFYRVAKLESGLSNVLATAVATVPAYYLNRNWTWGRTGRSHVWREIVPFWVIAAVGLVLSTIAVEVASHEAHRLSSAHQVQTILVEAANLFTYGVLWVGKFLLFNGVLFKSDAPVPAGGPGALGEDGSDELAAGVG